MSPKGKGSIEALVPRGLLLLNSDELIDAPVNVEGLSAIRVKWRSGIISAIEIIAPDGLSPKKLLLPRLFEPHAHLDKAFTWKQFANLRGTYQCALSANMQEHEIRSKALVRQRAEKAMALALRNGVKAIRSHVDVLDGRQDESWESLVDLQCDWRGLIELQLVALSRLDFWSGSPGRVFAKKVAQAGGLLGGVIVPPFEKKIVKDSLQKLLSLAEELGCGIDLHVDEAASHPAAGLQQLLSALEEMKISVPITCSHLSSMALMSTGELNRLAERMAHHKIKVVALPLTNSWLLGRTSTSRATPLVRPVAPVCQLQNAGVTVAVGGDNVQDSWFPAGNFDPIALMGFSLAMVHLAPWQRLGLAPFTSAAAEVMGIDWNGGVQIGNAADFLLVDAASWSEAMAAPPTRKVMINGNWID
ncbi:amidohydrolase family protein [Prochlorococcus sp. MIT 1300]|uniref:amidohydrolase family protein n=1 Tax=Prochlorococcus sp. MIT 1300 TaxID=3096218 RepID=UPI002A7625B9|nr:amidohydrolase family protein [Prochlorococcus sp. MIT 1300]